MNFGILEKRTPILASMVVAILLVIPTPARAQRGGGGGGGRGAGGAGAPAGQAGRGGRGGAAAGRGNAAIDLTGYWVSVVTEDWALRMITPPKGRFNELPLNNEGRTVGNTWDPAKDEAAGEQCRAYGAAGIMRLPGRLHITWENDTTLRIDTDTGTQIRLLHFGAPATPLGDPTWQGNSVAQWEPAPGGGRGGRGGGTPSGGDLKVVTTNLRSGYIRKNGAPYSKNAIVTEYFDLNPLPNGDQWLTVTTTVEDSQYFSRPYVTTSDFKKLPDVTGWSPSPCSAK